MEQGSKAPSATPAAPRRGGGNKTARRIIHEDRVVKAAVPPGSRFKGYQDFVVQDLVLRAHVLRLRRECRVTPEGRRITAALPAGISAGHLSCANPNGERSDTEPAASPSRHPRRPCARPRNTGAHKLGRPGRYG
jgi:hypothetical protein